MVKVLDTTKNEVKQTVTTGGLNRSRTIAATAVLAALAVAINILSPLRIPAPFAPFLFYEIWEVPLVLALLLYGLKSGVSVAIINFLALVALFTGALPTGPFYNLIAVLSMMLGVYISYNVAYSSIIRKLNGVVWLPTLLGAVIRVAVMSVVNWIVLPLPYPVGFNLPLAAVIPIMPLVALFNATQTPISVIPAQILAKAVSLRTRSPPWMSKFIKSKN